MIRNVQAADLPACLEVIRKSFATVAEEFGLTPENCPTHTSFVPLSRLEGEFRRGDEMYALFQGEVMVGFAQLASQGDGAFELKKLAVLPEYRHLGYGRQLLDHVWRRALALGGRRLTVGIIEESAVLKEWYQRNGFRPTGTRRFDHLPFLVGYLERTL